MYKSRPLVNVGDKIKKSVIADGPATDLGELVLVKCFSSIYALEWIQF